VADLSKAHTVLSKNRNDAISLTQSLGVQKTRLLLEYASRDLQKKIAQRVRAKTGETFTLTQLRTTLVQVREVLRDLIIPGMHGVILNAGEKAAEHAADHVLDYLSRADREFRGVGTQPLAIREASMLENAVEGARSSMLHRLAASGTDEGVDDEEHPARPGVLQRYGMATIDNFEKTLQHGLIARKPWSEMSKDITKNSPFLQKMPTFWATRIVRTEVMGAYSRSTWESIREADDDLEDMVKIVSSVFDERTAADSYALHGAIRRPEEAFETWYGFMQHPPDRPNDRGIIVPHRISWPIPPYLAWRDEEDVMKAWLREGRKGAPPERPLMTTIDLQLFGQAPPPKQVKRKESSSESQPKDSESTQTESEDTESEQESEEPDDE
jgi:hypothetical protein